MVCVSFVLADSMEKRGSVESIYVVETNCRNRRDEMNAGATNVPLGVLFIIKSATDTLMNRG